MSNWLVLPLTLLLVLPPFLLGGVHPLTYGGLGALAGGVGLLLGWRIYNRSAQTEASIYLGPWFALFALAWAFTLFQLIPLPTSLLSSLAPGTYSVFEKTLGAVGLLKAGVWQPLSLAPPETAAKLVRDTAFLLTFLVVLQWAHQRARVRFLMSLSIFSALAMCGLVSFQTMVGIEKPLLGLVQTTSSNPSLFLGIPFLNPEHFSGFLLFNTLLTLPLFINNIHARERLGWTVACAILFVFLLLTLSVTSVVLCLLGALIFLGFLGRRLFQEQEEDPTKIDPAYAPLPFLNISPATAQPLSESGAIKQYPSTQRAQEQTDEASSEAPKKRKLFKKNYQRSSRDPKPVWKGWKFIWERPLFRVLFAIAVLFAGYFVASSIQSTAYRLAPKSKPAPSASFSDSFTVATTLASNYPLFGAGRGSTPLAWTRFATQQGPYQGQKTLTHVESQWLQPLADWGLLGGLYLLVLLGLFGLTLLRSRGMLERGLWIALAMLYLQNVNDFGLAYLGTAIPFAMFLAALLRLQYNRDEGVKLYSLRNFGLFVAVGLIAVVLATPYARKYAYNKSTAHWNGVSVQKPQNKQKALQRLLKKFPSDYLVLSHLTEHYARLNPWQPKKALQWSQRGLFLNPMAAEIYLYRGYIFARLKQADKATKALSQSVSIQQKFLGKAARVATQFGMEQHILAGSPSVQLVAKVLQYSPRCQTKPSICLRWSSAANKRFPKAFLLVQEQAFLQMRQLSLAPSKDAKEEGYKTLQQTLTQIRSAFPKQHVEFEHLLEGYLAESKQKYSLAEKHFEWVLKKKKAYMWEAFQAQYMLLATQRRTASLTKLFQQVKHVFRKPKKAALVAYREAMFLQLQGKLKDSLVRFGSATLLDPKNKYWLGMADVCKKLKQYRCAVRIYNRLVKQKQFEYLKPEIKRLKPFTIVQ